jgi:hypothetical protein
MRIAGVNIADKTPRLVDNAEVIPKVYKKMDPSVCSSFTDSIRSSHLMTPGKENRKVARSKHDSVLELYDSGGNLIMGIGRLVDFSRTGACFSTPQVLEQNKPLRARIRLLSVGVIEATAHIIWSRRKVNTILYGIEFRAIHSSKQND